MLVQLKIYEVGTGCNALRFWMVIASCINVNTSVAITTDEVEKCVAIEQQEQHQQQL